MTPESVVFIPVERISIWFKGDFERDEVKLGVTTRVYGRMKCSVYVNDKYKSRTLFFRRDNFDEKWLKLCDWFAEAMGWKKPPGYYLTGKPKFDEVLKKCGVIESKSTSKRNTLVYDLVTP